MIGLIGVIIQLEDHELLISVLKTTVMTIEKVTSKNLLHIE